MTLVSTPTRPSSRRVHAQAGTSTSFDDFLSVLDNLRLAPRAVTVDVERRVVSVDHAAVDLCHQEFELLAHLARNADRTVSREELFETVWSTRDLDEGSRTVDAHIRRLRRKLDAPGLITTVRGEGYRFNSAPSVRVVRTRKTALAA